MGHPNSSLTLGIPFASADGRFYSRFPQGNRFSEAGLASGALPVAVSNAIAAAASSGLTAMELDFLARASAPGVKYATNFTDVWLDGVKNAARSGIASSAQMRAEALEIPGDDTRVTRDTTIKLSGASLRLETLPTTDRQEGSWAFTPNGRDSTLFTEVWLQFAVYLPRQTLAYRWQDNGDSFQKFINFGQAGTGQVVVGYTQFCGFISTLINQSSSVGGQLYSYSSSQNPFGITTSRENPAIGAGIVLSPTTDLEEEWLNTYGPLPRALAQDPNNTTDYDYNAADPYLDTRAGNLFGWPDSRALASGAVPWQKDGWTVVEVHLKHNGPGFVSTIQLWAAPYGQPPVLLIDEVGTVDLGDANGDSTPNSWDRFELLNYATGRQPEPGRPVQYTYYDEIISSAAPINFPGGHSLFGQSGAAPTFAEDMTLGKWEAISGNSPGLGLAATSSGTRYASNVDPNPSRSQPYSGSSGFNSIFTAWGSSIFVPTLGSKGSLLFYGGGHRDYYGNCIVRFDIATRQWSLLSQPSTAGPFTAGALLTNGAYTDGTPSPPHPYQFLQYDPISNSLVCLKSISNINAPDTGNSGVARPWMYDIDDAVWRRGPENTSLSCPSNGCACYDTTRHVFWTLDHAGGDFGQFNPAGDNGNGTFGSWTSSLQSASFGSGSAIGHDPDTDRLIIFNYTTGTLWRKDPNNIATARVAVTQTGAPSMVPLSPAEYSRELSGFVVMMAGTGNVYLVRTTNSWTSCTWTLLTTSTNGQNFSDIQDNGNPVNGINGRMRVAKYPGGAVLLYYVRTANDPVLSMRLR